MNIKNIVVLLALSGTVLQSCSKLDLPPVDQIDASKAFRNLEDVNMGVLGAYAVLNSGWIDAVAVVADEAMLPTENTVSNTSSHRWIYDSSSGSVTSAFYDLYMPVGRANLVLEAIPKLSIGSGEQNLLNQYQAELLALRAYSHFELLRGYASSYAPDGMGVPYMKKYEVTYPGRPTVQSNFDDIFADLKAAKELMPDGFSDNSRITKTAISAIQARVALYAKKWDEASSFATEVIAKEPLAPKNDFGKIWKDESQAELVWRLPRLIGESRVGAAFYRETGDIVLYAPSFKLINLFGTTVQRNDDVRFVSYIKYDANRPTGKSQYSVEKYTGGKAGYRGLADIKLFRTAEMYLIRAEAELEKGNGATALSAGAKDLNDLRAARIYNYIAQNFVDKQSLLNAIYNERFKELAFEGHRFFDLKRRGLPVERTAQDAINTVGAIKLEPTAAQYCFPIPAEEMKVNKSMEQNPNYGGK
ncbi:RagB/SusD family nutrient uptake outer membrane protein [Sphingobacterium yanglingense]|uniref:Putative outer membrane starch-binding protein n=1 Tax=Sphingobacterium yanglingense TaxID=1437280 RepID=A0A4R6W4V6_9SPHI|nr:RagB/SusD family nutrient uptake outer membrane protein [Sphingobacterium yanglingense]TDQ72254.1 putative outer membrane starch-binding protein [Sphingobacterium yanglingense]